MDPIIETDADGNVTGAIYFLYNPSKPAAWTFVVLFAGATIVHFILMFPFRAAFFVPLVIGGISKAAQASPFSMQARQLLTIASGNLRLLRTSMG